MDMSLSDIDELYPGYDVEHVIEEMSAKDVVEKVEAWEKKQMKNNSEENNDNDG
jgi:hypothetical protein